MKDNIVSAAPLSTLTLVDNSHLRSRREERPAIHVTPATPASNSPVEALEPVALNSIAPGDCNSSPAAMPLSQDVAPSTTNRRPSTYPGNPSGADTVDLATRIAATLGGENVGTYAGMEESSAQSVQARGVGGAAMGTHTVTLRENDGDRAASSSANAGLDGAADAGPSSGIPRQSTRAKQPRGRANMMPSSDSDATTLVEEDESHSLWWRQLRCC